jgi:phospholipid/cholesterol/gamma-HCH transport system substrate-binding protein
VRLTRRIIIQLVIFAVISVTAGTTMVFNFIGLPNLLFGVGHYRITVELPEAAGLYKSGNVTYRGTEVGRVESVRLSGTGVVAELSMNSGIDIPSNVTAAVHSVSAVGEQYVALIPVGGNATALKQGDVIPRDRTTVPPDINTLLDSANRGLLAIPRDNLKTVVDESYTAFAGLGPDIARFVKGSTALAIDADANLGFLTNDADHIAPVLDTQTDTANSVQGWASHLANVTAQLKSKDAALQGILVNGPAAAGQARDLVDRLKPTLPVLLANLSSIEPVLITYRADLEQLLVLLPQGTAQQQAIGVANRYTKQSYRGAYLSFNLNLNVPPPCTTGFLPAQQWRPGTAVDSPDRPAGDLYCRVPQDSPFNVRGARNLPCETRPGKRAPTVAMCESDENYVPLNDGYNWKGDPNGTLSGQDIPQLPPAAPRPAPPAETRPAPPTPAPPPIAAAEYDPATQTYVGPDGHPYTQAEVASPQNKERTWQDMLLPHSTS